RCAPGKFVKRRGIFPFLLHPVNGQKSINRRRALAAPEAQVFNVLKRTAVHPLIPKIVDQSYLLTLADSVLNDGLGLFRNPPTNIIG
ncbi:MAG: hypothetical protein AAF146_21010, partial [Bacteroidota bacterium]